MAEVLVSPGARGDLDGLIARYELPTRERVKARLRRIGDLPYTGRALPGEWEGFRYTPGPWRWMLIVYQFDEEADVVIVATIQDARTGTAATAVR